MEPIPKTMRALGARKYCKPDEYEIMEVPVPKIKAPDDVLIQIHAVGITVGDALVAAGTARMVFPSTFPIILGRQGSGVVVAVGSGVKSLRIGDAVYGVGLKHPLRKVYGNGSGGWCAEYALTTEDLLLPKPPQVSFEDAAAVLPNLVTAIQNLRASLNMNPKAFPGGSLEGKTVLVEAGLGASTAIGAQYIKNVLGAKEVIATVSTAKVPLVHEYMPGVVDRVLDYQTQDIVAEIGRGRVDVLYSAQRHVMSLLPVMNPEHGIMSAIGLPSSSELKKILAGDGERLAWWMRLLVGMVGLLDLWYRWKLRGTNVQLKFVSGALGMREDVEKAGEIIATGKVRAVKTLVSFDDLEAIRKGCDQARTLKGKTGSLVVKIA
ncbi:hypothetical protein M406DRAFT_76229 [Cryphonectria parasitica EP155]|uniref:Enoyl reductase (ER) domain-containing protein n=1 Tax=Cryphonectria parasitica (strain ATCC 38755 / EP155) TaxID=660469 RepID=A0A9P5CLC4_CRYP1|nr:uncharacterized protein M406DRAFT_76229 [Cryphonectria parasitica EP155]KAF3762077.1 hypothetical protein M406DRAFT_76229 [Cryphonectria parasitica EP155]